ncbi:hypothetical protein B0H10DRAFT_2202930, partial [Mycena sp. CBHHK59/15]
MAQEASQPKYANTSKRFWDEETFGFPHTEAAMTTVFGPDRSSKEAQAWTVYWSALGAEEEKKKARTKYRLPPMPLIDGSLPDVEMDSVETSGSGTQPMLCNASLTADHADRARERAERKNNGNQHGKEKKGFGRTFDDIMASVFIERESPNSNKVMKPVYYCLGCDNPVRNNTRGRNSAHMLGCKALQRDFPATWDRFKKSIDPSSESVASGDALAPALRTKKRKIENPAEGREPI